MLVLFACAPSPSPHDPTPISSSTTRPPAPTWDPAPAPVACPLDDPDPVLDAALSDAGLDRDGVTYDATSWSANAYQADLDDPFRLSWFRGVHDAPLRVSCDARQVAADLDAVLDAPHPAAVAIGLAMARLGVDPVGQPVDPAALDRSTCRASRRIWRTRSSRSWPRWPRSPRPATGWRPPRRTPRRISSSTGTPAR